MRHDNPASVTTDVAWMTPIFFLSGAAALTYQVAWERVLYAIFGVNTESVTVVVTAFLLGLGLGSMAGGWVSARPGCRHLWWFAAVELAIGAFGAASIAFYHGIGRLTIELSSIATGAVTFLLVLVPTILMGATLPLLVAYAVGRTGSVGLSVGALYGANTAGSALAAILTVAVLLPQLGLHASVRVAAACNAVVAVATVIRAMRERSPAPRARPIGVREVV